MRLSLQTLSLQTLSLFRLSLSLFRLSLLRLSLSLLETLSLPLLRLDSLLRLSLSISLETLVRLSLETRLSLGFLVPRPCLYSRLCSEQVSRRISLASCSENISYAFGTTVVLLVISSTGFPSLFRLCLFLLVFWMRRRHQLIPSVPRRERQKDREREGTK